MYLIWNQTLHPTVEEAIRAQAYFLSTTSAGSVPEDYQKFFQHKPGCVSIADLSLLLPIGRNVYAALAEGQFAFTYASLNMSRALKVFGLHTHQTPATPTLREWLSVDKTKLEG